MNSLLSKIGTISAILLLCLFNSIDVYADEDIRLEGHLSTYEMRSLPISNPITATLSENNINITFYKACTSIDITVKEVGTNNIIYSQNHQSPRNVNIPLENYEYGTYILELRTQNGYMYGIFDFIN